MTPEHQLTVPKPSLPKEWYYAAPTHWVSKEDLLYSRPDLAELIEAESEVGLVEYVADKVGDALQEIYWEAVNQALTRYFGVSESDDGQGGGDPL